MTQQPPREPTMEEILASIRRIIAEESPAAKDGRKVAPLAPAVAPGAVAAPVAPPTRMAPPAPAPLPTEKNAPLGPPPAIPLPVGEVLELTELVGESAAGEPEPLELTELLEAQPPAAVAPGAEAPAALAAMAEPLPRRAAAAAQPLLAPAVEAEVVAGMATVAAGLRPPPAAVQTSGASPLDPLVREALQPALRDWLERNLPALVERVVREELRRLARRVEDG